MSFRNWLQGFRNVLAPGHGRRQHRRRAAQRPARYRPGIEALENRLALSFVPTANFPVGDNPLEVVAAEVTADFNNDGRLDLATANYDQATGDGSVSVLLGDGGFQAAKVSPTGWHPVSLTAGDFDADGKIDLATANWLDGRSGEYSNNTVSILRGNGDGTFAAPVGQSISEEVLEDARSIASGDLNADGKLDLVVTGYDGAYSHVEVLLGHGDGSFAADTTYDEYYGPLHSPMLRDFNGDGKVDVVVASYMTESVMAFLGNGDGTLQEPRGFSVGIGGGIFDGPGSLAAGDFNADGKLDLATANSSSNSVGMLLGNGDGTFQAARSFAAGNGPQSATASDVNGDGKLDVVVANSSSTSPPGGVSVLLGGGGGSLGPPITTATATGGPYSNSVVMADFNGDGRPDAAATSAAANNIAVLLNDGVWAVPTAPPRVTVGDVTKAEGKNRSSTSFTFTVSLSAASDQPVTVSFRTVNGTAKTSNNDYVAKSGTITFAPGETTKTITIVVKGDRKRESNETFYLDLFGLSSNAQFTKNRGLGTILNDD